MRTRPLDGRQTGGSETSEATQSSDEDDDDNGSSASSTTSPTQEDFDPQLGGEEQEEDDRQEINPGDVSGEFRDQPVSSPDQDTGSSSPGEDVDDPVTQPHSGGQESRDTGEADAGSDSQQNGDSGDDGGGTRERTSGGISGSPTGVPTPEVDDSQTRRVVETGQQRGPDPTDELSDEVRQDVREEIASESRFEPGHITVTGVEETEDGLRPEIQIDPIAQRRAARRASAEQIDEDLEEHDVGPDDITLEGSVGGEEGLRGRLNPDAQAQIATDEFVTGTDSVGEDGRFGRDDVEVQMDDGQVTTVGIRESALVDAAAEESEEFEVDDFETVERRPINPDEVTGGGGGGIVSGQFGGGVSVQVTDEAVEEARQEALEEQQDRSTVTPGTGPGFVAVGDVEDENEALRVEQRGGETAESDSEPGLGAEVVSGAATATSNIPSMASARFVGGVVFDDDDGESLGDRARSRLDPAADAFDEAVVEPLEAPERGTTAGPTTAGDVASSPFIRDSAALAASWANPAGVASGAITLAEDQATVSSALRDTTAEDGQRAIDVAPLIPAAAAGAGLAAASSAADDPAGTARTAGVTGAALIGTGAIATGAVRGTRTVASSIRRPGSLDDFIDARRGQADLTGQTRTTDDTPTISAEDIAPRQEDPRQVTIGPVRDQGTDVQPGDAFQRRRDRTIRAEDSVDDPSRDLAFRRSLSDDSPTDVSQAPPDGISSSRFGASGPAAGQVSEQEPGRRQPNPGGLLIDERGELRGGQSVAPEQEDLSFSRNFQASDTAVASQFRSVSTGPSGTFGPGQDLRIGEMTREEDGSVTFDSGGTATRGGSRGRGGGRPAGRAGLGELEGIGATQPGQRPTGRGMGLQFESLGLSIGTTTTPGFQQAQRQVRFGGRTTTRPTPTPLSLFGPSQDGGRDRRDSDAPRAEQSQTRGGPAVGFGAEFFDAFARGGFQQRRLPENVDEGSVSAELPTETLAEPGDDAEAVADVDEVFFGSVTGGGSRDGSSTDDFDFGLDFGGGR